MSWIVTLSLERQVLLILSIFLFIYVCVFIFCCYSSPISFLAYSWHVYLSVVQKPDFRSYCTLITIDWWAIAGRVSLLNEVIIVIEWIKPDHMGSSKLEVYVQHLWFCISLLRKLDSIEVAFVRLELWHFVPSRRSSEVFKLIFTVKNWVDRGGLTLRLLADAKNITWKI